MEGYTVNPKGKTKKNKKVGIGALPLQPRAASPPFKQDLQARLEANLPTKKPSLKKGTVKKALNKPTMSVKKRLTIKKPNIVRATKIKTPSPVRAKTPSPVRAKTPSPVRAKTPSPVKPTTKKPTTKKKLIIIKRIKPTLEIEETIMQPIIQPPIIQREVRGFVPVLEELSDIMQRQGEPFKARAYQKAQESIMTYEGDIYTIDQIKNLPGIGKAILSKLDEYMRTGTLQILERERKNPINILTRVYGIGPKKAAELVKAGIKSIADLRAHPELLNDVQRIGLKYFEAIESRIPRSEIDEYKRVFSTIFHKSTPAGSTMDIVGSYRRGAKESGDIDTLVTNQDNNSSVLASFLDQLIEDKIIIEVLSRGKTKSLTIAQLPGYLPRRVDFLYAPPSEYAFALLYFTGSKTFNTVQRAKALKLGYTLNEHGLYHMVAKEKGAKEKGAKVKGEFPNEQAIFRSLDMEYKEPSERGTMPVSPITVKEDVPAKIKPLRKTLKIKKPNTGIIAPAAAPLSFPKESVLEVSHHPLIPTAPAAAPLPFPQRGVLGGYPQRESDLSALLRAANNAYYCNHAPIMSDNEYDLLREHTLSRFPNNAAAQEGHTQCIMNDEKNKVKLPYEMWSMDKIKPDTKALIKWQQTYKGPYILSCKLDGISGLYSTEGSKPKLYTRGNGTVGQDISHFLPFLNLPQEKGITLRGEFIITKAAFALKYAKDFANSRNFMGGVINSKTPDPIKCADIDFVTYEVLNPLIKPSEQMQFLLRLQEIKETKKKKSAFKVVQHFISPTISNELLSELLVKWRAEYAYEIDGIICINDGLYPRQTGNPAHAFAFKMVLSDQIAEAKVIEVIWTPSKDGLLKPRVHIEPVQLSGVKIEYATGFNAKFIEDNKIGMGALIRLMRSGDVIPHIIAVVQPAAQVQMPTAPYEWNGTRVDIMLLNKDDNPIVKEKNITLFFSSLDVLGLGAGNVKKIIAAGFDTVPKILNMSEADFLLVQGFKQKMAMKVKDSIIEKVEKASLAELMHATNIFGRGFGVKKFRLILSKETAIVTDTKLSSEEKVKRLTSLEGLAKKTAEQFVSQIPLFLVFLKEANLLGKLQSTADTADTAANLAAAPAKDLTTHPLYGKQFIMTGSRDKALLEKLQSLGAEQGSAVRKATFVVLVKDMSEETSKTTEAKKLGIPIMTFADFKFKYQI